MHFVGLISGTSMDAVDAVVAELGADAPPRLVTALAYPIPAELRTRCRRLVQGCDDEIRQLMTLDGRFGRLFADAALAVIREAGLTTDAIRAIGSHGQTIRHYPVADICQSLQIGDANIIAEATGITTVADFRRRDMAAAGQGAPLVPAFHRHVLHSADENRVILNIGGIANVTILPASGEVSGFDTGPGNTLLDMLAREHLGQPFDAGGAWAAGGRVDDTLLRQLLADPYFTQAPPKSTGTETYHADWLAERIGTLARPAARDLAATLTELTAATTADAIQTHASTTDAVLVCGGGVHNAQLMHKLAQRLTSMRVASTASLGVDPDWVEAMTFAWLAQRRLDEKSGNVASVTGAGSEKILGAVFAGG